MNPNFEHEVQSRDFVHIDMSHGIYRDTNRILRFVKSFQREPRLKVEQKMFLLQYWAFHFEVAL